MPARPPRRRSPWEPPALGPLSAPPIRKIPLLKPPATGQRQPRKSCSSTLLVLPRVARPPRDLFQTRRLRPPGLPEVLVDFIAVAHLRTGITDQLPTNQAGVSAMH